MNQETLEKMRQMRLLGIYNAFKTSMDSFKAETMTTDQFVSWLVSNEWDDRCNRMIERLIKQASFRYKASLEQIDYSLDRGLDRNQLQRLAELSFVKEAKDLFVTGSAGTGKSYIATALGYRACQKGLKVLCKYSQINGTTQSSQGQRNNLAGTQENRADGFAYIG